MTKLDKLVRYGRFGCFKGRQFNAEVILWSVRWYLMFPITYRDLELMLRDRGVTVAHSTVSDNPSAAAASSPAAAARFR